MQTVNIELQPILSGVLQFISYPNVKGTATLPTATSAAASNNIIKATGADMSMVVLAVLALAAALVAGFACIVRKQGLGK